MSAVRNADVLKVLIAKMGEYGNINLILGKTLSVLPETELFQPVRNLLHRGSVACSYALAARGVYPTRLEIEGRFLASLMFLPSLLAIANEVIE